MIISTTLKQNAVVSYLFDIPPGIYLLKLNNVNTRTMCKICLKFNMKTLKQRF